MAEPQPQFWFPQIPDNSPNQLHSQAVVKAINQVLELFTSEPRNKQDVLSASSFCTTDILQFLEPGTKLPFYILGTVTENEAIMQSWKDLGLNLFDLPWGRLPRIFRYIPILSLPEMLKAATRKRYEDDGALKCAKNDLQWARCHEWIRKIQNCFGHGKRDAMQFYGAEEAKKEIPGIPEKLPCQSCYVKDILSKACDKMLTDGNLHQLLRCVANLDCQGYHLAPLSSIPLDITARYKRVVILEDDENMRNYIETIIKERYGKGIVQKANVKESQKKWCFCGDDGREIKLRDKKLQ